MEERKREGNGSGKGSDFLSRNEMVIDCKRRLQKERRFKEREREKERVERGGVERRRKRHKPSFDFSSKSDGNEEEMRDYRTEDRTRKEQKTEFEE